MNLHELKQALRSLLKFNAVTESNSELKNDIIWKAAELENAIDAYEEGLTSEIADFLVTEGTRETTSGNWCISFEDVAEEFDVDYGWVESNAERIVDYMDSNHEEILSETWLDNGEFDMNFGLAYCPNVEGDGCVW